MQSTSFPAAGLTGPAVAGPGASVYPPLQPAELQQYRVLFAQVDTNRDGLVTVGSHSIVHLISEYAG
jgi:hypothetical protein